MEFKTRTLNQIAKMICGDIKDNLKSYFIYRSSFYLTEFFADAETEFTHDGSTRPKWVSETLSEILKEPGNIDDMPSDTFCRVIQNLMDQSDAFNESKDRTNALLELNTALSRENFEAFYAEDNKCYLKYIPTQKVLKASTNPHRPFSVIEAQKREILIGYLDKCSEDDLIEEILIPLFRQLGFHKISVAGHKDKSLEYGKDIWMKLILPTQHWLYFGIQVKKGKLDAAGMTKGSNSNISEIHNQVLMMLGHEIFDPEIGKKVLVDHAFIVAGGEITKAAKNWLGGKLDTSKRSQILFMDRDDILNQFIVNNLPLPDSAVLKRTFGNFKDLSF
ncbi:hypothetical protein [Flavobacterium subsaxonicum]|uniref:Restriction endonuclease type IV Mrr domain-containing protein n=1 Tax=Flavobacterium subsaxonicum WB 4.1-42 = DSM 21790 TaxID=1121898 RepID=A0A0A2MJV1_9FLAO|nr:hypothetical protein [Flavobacterium subsaxonicum]KGO92922.1 hypothetical protein Q766_09820 [Flavobacterium subsaxonicum WB 4.1-42 = DSM 21790]